MERKPVAVSRIVPSQPRFQEVACNRIGSDNRTGYIGIAVQHVCGAKRLVAEHHAKRTAAGCVKGFVDQNDRFATLDPKPQRPRAVIDENGFA